MFGETAAGGWTGCLLQIRLSWHPAMVKALRRWLEANGLPAIAAGVLGTVLMISLLLVCGGYLIVRALS